MNGGGILVLRTLDQEHHQKRDDRSAGVDDELPGIGEVEERPQNSPEDDGAAGQRKRPGTARPLGCGPCCPLQPSGFPAHTVLLVSNSNLAKNLQTQCRSEAGESGRSLPREWKTKRLQI